MAEYDYIIIGSGTAGSVIAGRLSEDPDVHVLVVEAGGTDRWPIITMPGALPFVYQSKRLGWHIQSGPEPFLGGRTIDEKAGKVIGGGSSINAMIVNRGNPMDYQGWADDGLSTWDWAHVLPYFRKFESFVEGENAWRGGSGPMHISRCRAAHKMFDVWLEAGNQAGFETTPDHNGEKQEGMHIAQSFTYKGERWSAARGYLRPALKRGNVTLMSNTMVNKVVLENGRAVGIEIAHGNSSQNIRCTREVIVSAGAMNSPKLLMLSGIGNPDELRPLGIQVNVASKNVGENLQNHPGVDVQYLTDAKDSMTSQLGIMGRARIGLEWGLFRKGLGADNFFEGGAFLRTRDNVTFPNMQYEFLPLTRQLVNGKLIPIAGFQVWMDLSRPLSRGKVSLRSANPADNPSVVFNTYSERQDLIDMIDGVKLAREIVRQQAFAKYTKGEFNPGFDVQSDSDLEAFVRSRTGTSYHPSGALRMGTDAAAVVDEQGRVNGVDALRVIDASIMPRVITGNLNAPVLMMAEKIADQIRGRKLEPSTAGFYFEEKT